MRQLLFLLVLLPTAAWAVDTPGVDQQRSWYDTAFTLTITAPAGASLRYTTDGSRPSASHGTAAGTSVALSVAQSTVVRAVAIDKGRRRPASCTASGKSCRAWS